MGHRVPSVMSSPTATYTAVFGDSSIARSPLRQQRVVACAQRRWSLCECLKDDRIFAKLPAVLAQSAQAGVQVAGTMLAACVLTGTLLTSSAQALPSDTQSIQSDVLVVCCPI